MKCERPASGTCLLLRMVARTVGRELNLRIRPRWGRTQQQRRRWGTSTHPYPHPHPHTYTRTHARTHARTPPHPPIRSLTDTHLRTYTSHRRELNRRMSYESDPEGRTRSSSARGYRSGQHTEDSDDVNYPDEYDSRPRRGSIEYDAAPRRYSIVGSCC